MSRTEPSKVNRLRNADSEDSKSDKSSSIDMMARAKLDNMPYSVEAPEVKSIGNM